VLKAFVDHQEAAMGAGKIDDGPRIKPARLRDEDPTEKKAAAPPPAVAPEEKSQGWLASAATNTAWVGQKITAGSRYVQSAIDSGISTAEKAVEPPLNGIDPLRSTLHLGTSLVGGAVSGLTGMVTGLVAGAGGLAQLADADTRAYAGNALKSALSHPGETLGAVGKNLLNAVAENPAHALGYAASFAVPGLGAAKLIGLGRAGEAAAGAEKVVAGAEKAVANTEKAVAGTVNAAQATQTTTAAANTAAAGATSAMEPNAARMSAYVASSRGSPAVKESVAKAEEAALSGKARPLGEMIRDLDRAGPNRFMEAVPTLKNAEEIKNLAQDFVGEAPKLFAGMAPDAAKTMAMNNLRVWTKWMDSQGRLPGGQQAWTNAIDQASSTIRWVGARSEHDVMAGLRLLSGKGASLQQQLTQGVQTVMNPIEMKMVVNRFVREAPGIFAKEELSVADAHARALQHVGEMVARGETMPGTRHDWGNVIDGVSHRLQQLAEPSETRLMDALKRARPDDPFEYGLRNLSNRDAIETFVQSHLRRPTQAYADMSHEGALEAVKRHMRSVVFGNDNVMPGTFDTWKEILTRLGVRNVPVL
jgi:hypothetical protein